MAPDETGASSAAAAPGANREIYGRMQAEALEAVEHCLSLVPIKCLAEVDKAERAINRLRDRLIADLRRTHDAVLQAALEQTNVALSLVVGVEYPATGSQRQPLEMARTCLSEIHLTGPA